MNLNKIKLLAGDASFRKFYRSSNNSIIVFAKKNKHVNLVVYDAINRCLNKNKVKAPTGAVLLNHSALTSAYTAS